MDITTHDELLETINATIDYLAENESEFYVALEVAYQLRDEIIQACPEEE